MDYHNMLPRENPSTDSILPTHGGVLNLSFPVKITTSLRKI